MALITRLSRLFTADVHAVLDRMEEPEVLLKQALREMTEELSRGERRIQWLKRELAQIAVQSSEIDRGLKEAESELDVCFDAGQEELAKKLIRRQLELRQRHKQLTARRSALERELTERQADLEENRKRYESLKQKAEVLAEETEHEDERPAEAWSTWRDVMVRDEEVEVAFLREQQKRRRS